MLKDFHCDFSYCLTGDISSLDGANRVEGNSLDLADFPHLKELNLITLPWEGILGTFEIMISQSWNKSSSQRPSMVGGLWVSAHFWRASSYQNSLPLQTTSPDDTNERLVCEAVGRLSRLVRLFGRWRDTSILHSLCWSGISRWISIGNCSKGPLQSELTRSRARYR